MKQLSTVDGWPQQARDMQCPEPGCGFAMVLASGPHGVYYACRNRPRGCRGAHGADQRTGAPMGIPGDAETRQARNEAHAALDRVWKDRLCSRDDAYSWMARVLDIPRDAAHVGRLTKAQCELVTYEAKRWRKQLRNERSKARREVRKKLGKFS